MAVNIRSLSYKGKIFFRDCQHLNQIFKNLNTESSNLYCIKRE